RTVRTQTAAEAALALTPFAEGGPTAWAPGAGPAGGAGEPFAIPGLLDSDPRADTSAFDEIAALARTLTPEQSATPLSSNWLMPSTTGEWRQRHRVHIAIGLAVALVLGLFAVAAFLSFLVPGCD